MARGSKGAAGKYLGVAERIARRVRRGDYACQPVPSEQRLADETGVSRMTLRKAVDRLVQQGVLQRRPNGRIGIANGRGAAKAQIALLAPAYPSLDVDAWRVALERAAAPFGAHVRPVDYVHPDDPVIGEALRGFDGIFLAASGDPLPTALLTRLRNNRRPVVMLNWDMSAAGLRSISLFPTRAVTTLLEHLRKLGHQAVDCINAQPVDPDIQQRIQAWDTWRAARSLAGDLINSPVKPYQPVVDRVYEVMTRRLGTNAQRATAVLATTMPAAVGVLRAMHECGLRPGHDVSVCCVNDDGLAGYLVPSLTHLLRPDPAVHIRKCLNWMMTERPRNWTGPLCLQPRTASLFKGESTGPAPERRA